MRLTKIYLRFYKSFNYDYERKAHPEARPFQWELVGDRWFPFIQVPLDPVVTAVVGANESGKSHLIKAIRQGLTGEGIERSGFCRYSSLYSVEAGQLRVPDLGVELEIEEQDTESLTAVNFAASAGQTLTRLRLNGGENRVHDSTGEPIELNGEQLGQLDDLLPVPFELETDLGLPDSISLDALLGRQPSPLARRQRFDLGNLLRDMGAEVDQSSLTEHAAEIAGLFSRSDDPRGAAEQAEEDLARKLMIDVARIDPGAFAELEEALRAGEEGRVDGLIEEMNRSLARHLNFTRWWHQDSEFQLRVDPRERELVFTIRDRTGSAYSFNERSTGLKYFLGYYVQLRAHKTPPDRRQVLLMDEPDAYLSSTGQQDLLRVLEDFAEPEDGSRRDQVVYVTHSPFLINKNAAHRIRVLDKGSEEEGTRVVRDVARNHYEPLRSSVGAYVAETSFIGGSNLVVEGVSDQVLLVGMNALLRHRGTPPRELLDLNEVTIVPAGSAPEVPYIVYLARGRDENKPPCVALLDGDQSGKQAERGLARGEASGKPVLDAKYVVQLADWSADADLKVAREVELTEIEDLVPTRIILEAARSYATSFLRLSKDEAANLEREAIDRALASENGRAWKALERAFAAAYDGAHIDKTGFAKELVAYVNRVKRDEKRPPGLLDLEQNFHQLISYLAERLAAADRDEADRRRRRRLGRIIKGFLDDHPDGSTKDSAEHVLRAIESSLDETDPDDDRVRSGVTRLRRDFKLSVDPLESVPEFEDFRERLDALRYAKRLAHQIE